MNRKFLSVFLTIIMILSMTSTAFAEDKEYKISAINLIVTVTEPLNVLTRGVSESNPALEILDTDAVTMQNSFVQNNIYLDVFPDDLSYEILVSATELENKDKAGFNTLSDTELEEFMNRLSGDFASNENEELLFMELYENDVTKYIHLSTHFTLDDTSVYTERYYTVMNGFNYYFTLQTDNIEIGSELSSILTSMVNSAQYTEVKSSLTESGLFNEVYEMFIGFVLTVLILGTILFMVTRKPKH